MTQQLHLSAISPLLSMYSGIACDCALRRAAHLPLSSQHHRGEVTNWGGWLRRFDHLGLGGNDGLDDDSDFDQPPGYVKLMDNSKSCCDRAAAKLP
jgi:hypothetical protein